jgi:hypothetical protein
MNELESLLTNFPKIRPELPETYTAIYKNEYLKNREGKGSIGQLTANLESWMHKKVVGENPKFPMLELGAGTLNHIKFESNDGDYDIVEPFTDLYLGSDRLSRIRHIYSDIHEIPKNARYQRIISIAVLEHVLDLPVFIAIAAILLSENGEFQSGIPTEGSGLWYLAWRIGAGIPFMIRTGLDYRTLMKHEHVNSAHEILFIIKALFHEVGVQRFPSNYKHLSLYTSIVARKPNFENINKIISV